MKLCELQRECQDCGFDGAVEHHYTKGTDSDGSDIVEIFEYLCGDCHKERHTDLSGTVWDDVVEMHNHWYGYYKEMESEPTVRSKGIEDG